MKKVTTGRVLFYVILAIVLVSACLVGYVMLPKADTTVQNPTVTPTVTLAPKLEATNTLVPPSPQTTAGEASVAILNMTADNSVATAIKLIPCAKSFDDTFDSDTPLPTTFNDTFNVINGLLPSPQDFRAVVNKPGDSATFVINFLQADNNVYARRLWFDDLLQRVTFVVPGKQPMDITKMFEVICVGKGSTGNAVADQVMSDWGVNFTAGEALPQNSKDLYFANIPAGSQFIFEVRDYEKLGANVGMGIVMDRGEADALTVEVTIP